MFEYLPGIEIENTGYPDDETEELPIKNEISLSPAAVRFILGIIILIAAFVYCSFSESGGQEIKEEAAEIASEETEADKYLDELIVKISDILERRENID